MPEELNLTEFEKSMDTSETGEIFYSTPYSINLTPLRGMALKAYMKQVRQLPRPIFQTMTDQTTARYLNETLAPKFKLDQDQTKELTRIVRDVLLSSIYIGDLAQEIGTRMHVDART